MLESQFKPRIWHEAAKDAPDGFPTRAKMLFDHVRALEEDQVDIHLMNLLNSRLYYNREPMMFRWDQDFVQHFRPLNANSENCLQSVCDTLVSRIGTQKSKATIYTRGADFDVYLRGRDLDKFLWGEFQGLEIHKKQRKQVLDSMVCGTGIMKIAIDWEAEDIVAEITNPDEIIVDQRECASGDKPQTLFHRRLVSKLWVLKKFGGNNRALKRQIEDASKDHRYTSYRTPAEDQVVLIEAWKRPTLPGGSDGLHCIAIDGIELYSEKWDEDDFPFVFLRWADAPGFYGRSLVSDLLGMQIRLNKLNEAIEWGQDVMCVPRIFIDQGTQVLDTRLDNQIGKVVRFRGTVPEAITWNAFHAEMYNERDRVRASMFEFAGVSQMSAQNKMPDQMRMDSSEAIREFGAHEDERFNDKAQAIEENTLNIARKILKCASELYRTTKKSRTAVFRSGNLVEQIDWKDVDLDADKYVMQVAASSVLNLTPAARKDKLNFWFTNGLISPQKYMSLSGEPDLEHMSELQAAPTEHTEWQISQMLKAIPQVPDPNGDLVEAVVTVNNTYLHICTLRGVKPDVKRCFHNWLLTAEHLLNQPAPQPEVMMPPGPQPQVDPAMMGVPGAAPGMAPMPGPAPLAGPNVPAMMPPQ